jgi:hypothetical protein
MRIYSRMIARRRPPGHRLQPTRADRLPTGREALELLTGIEGASNRPVRRIALVCG